jgi:phosphatidylglycerol:prolipoprotein diacylglycerol transferase
LPTGPWLALLAAVALGGVAGAKVLRFDLAASAFGDKTVLGGILGGLLALLAGRRFLRMEAQALDALVPAVPVAVALGRIGCLLAGCCHGRPASVPWAVASSAHPGELLHPAPLYEAALVVLLAYGLARFRPRQRKPGSLALAFVAGYCGLRFVLEFWRCGGPDAFGLRVSQWTTGMAVLVAGAWLRGRERVARPPQSALVRAGSSGARAVALVSVVLTMTALAAPSLTPLEAVAVLFVTAIALVANLPGSLGARRPATACGVGVLLLAAPTPPPESSYPRSYVTVGGSGMGGSYQEGCGGMHDYRAFGFSVGYTKATAPEMSYSVRAQVFGGEDTERGELRRMPIRGVTLKGSLDTKYLGVTLGGAFGDFLDFDADPQHAFLVAGLRVGSKVFLEGRLADHEPTAFPGPVLQVGIGGRINKSGSLLRLGLSDTGLYLTANIVAGSGFEVEPFLSYGDERTHNYGLTVRKRFGKGARPVTE